MKSDIICAPGVRYFDYTASALALSSIENQLRNFLPNYANTHSASGKNSKATTAEYQKARARIKTALKLPPNYALIALGSGSSAAIKRFCELMGIHASPALRSQLAAKFGANYREQFADTLVICSAIEHHSNELAYREGLNDFARLGLREQTSDLFELERRCKEFRRKFERGRLIIAASAASNITGVRNDLRAMSECAKRYGAVFFVDATASLPYENLPVLPDAFAFSAHKFLGGCAGPGFLAINRALMPSEPSFAAGGTVEYVDRKSAIFYDDAELREEGGTPPILGVIKASLAIAHRDAVGLSAIAQKLQELKEQFLKEFLKIQFRHQLTLYAASCKNRLPIFAFNAARISPFELAGVLSAKYGIETRAGCACAGPYAHDLMNLHDGLITRQNGKLWFSGGIGRGMSGGGGGRMSGGGGGGVGGGRMSGGIGGGIGGGGGAKPGFVRAGLHYTHSAEDVSYLIEAIAKSCEYLRK